MQAIRSGIRSRGAQLGLSFTSKQQRVSRVSHTTIASTATMATILGKGSAKPELTDKLLFITTWSCPYAQRTWIALNESGLPHDKVYVDLDAKPEWLFEYNPLGKVPTIVSRGAADGAVQHAYESLVLNEMLAEMAPGKLLPEGPYARANARIMIDTVANQITGPFMKLMFGKGDGLASAVEEVNKQLEVLAGLLDKQQGPWLMGDHFSLADAALAPWILRMPVFEALKGVQLGGPGLARVQQYHKSLLARPCVADSIVLPSGQGSYEEQLTESYRAFLAKMGM